MDLSTNGKPPEWILLRAAAECAARAAETASRAATSTYEPLSEKLRAAFEAAKAAATAVVLAGATAEAAAYALPDMREPRAKRKAAASGGAGRVEVRAAERRGAGCPPGAENAEVDWQLKWASDGAAAGGADTSGLDAGNEDSGLAHGSGGGAEQPPPMDDAEDEAQEVRAMPPHSQHPQLLACLQIRSSLSNCLNGVRDVTRASCRTAADGTACLTPHQAGGVLQPR